MVLLFINLILMLDFFYFGAFYNDRGSIGMLIKPLLFAKVRVSQIFL